MSDFPKTEPKYWAFISYSHRDKAWGDWLHRSLETYRVPRKLVGQATSRGEPVPRRVFPIFRDREELPTAADLGANLRVAIDQSRYLVVICSPESARSQWVNEEILSFKRLGRDNRILALIVAGEPYASDGKPGFSADDECFPEALRYQLGPDGQLTSQRTEPIAADARPHADGKRQALIKLLAGIVGVNYDDLRRRDLLRKRRRCLLATATVIGASIAGLFVQTRFVAEQHERQFQAAIAELGRARETLSADLPASAALAALSAIETAEGAGRELEPAWWTLRRALDLNRVENRWFAAREAIQEVAFDREGKRLLSFSGATGETKIWSSPKGELLATFEAGEHAAFAGWLADQNEALALRYWERSPSNWNDPGEHGVDLLWWDPATGAQLRKKTLAGCYFLGLAESSGKLPAWIHVTDTGGDHPAYRLVRLSDGWAEQTIPHPSGRGGPGPEFIPECGVVLLADPEVGVKLYSLGANADSLGQLEDLGPRDKLRVSSIIPSPDGSSFAALVWSGEKLQQAGVWSAADGRRLVTFAGDDGFALGSRPWLRPVPPNVLASRSPPLLDALAAAVGRAPLVLPIYDPTGFAWSDDSSESGGVALALDNYGGASIHRPQAAWRCEVELGGSTATTIALAPNGTVAAIGDDRGQITLLRTNAPFELEPLKTAISQTELDLIFFGPANSGMLPVRASDGELQVWDIVNRQIAARANGFTEPAEGWLRFLTNLEAGWLVAAPSQSPSESTAHAAEASFHDLKSGQLLGRRPAADFILAPNQRRALGFWDGAWRVTRAEGNGLSDTLIDSARLGQSEWSGSVAFAAGGSEVAVATADGWIERFDSLSGQALGSIRFAEKQDTSINQLVISPSGRWALVATYNRWWRVDLQSGVAARVFTDEDLPDRFSDSSFLDGERLLLGAAGGQTKWWRFPELELLGQLPGYYAAHGPISQSGELLLRSPWEDEVLLVERDTAAIRHRYDGVLAVDASGKLAVIESQNVDQPRSRIVRLADGETLLDLSELRIRAAALASDGSRATLIRDGDGKALSVAIPCDRSALRQRAVQLRKRLSATTPSSSN